MISLEAFSDLLECLYAAPLNPREWQRFLTLLSRQTGSRQAVFLCADSRLGLSVRAAGEPLTEQDVSVYNQRYAAQDPFRGALIHNRNTGVFRGREVYSDERFLSSPLYRELLQPLDLRHVTLIPIALSLRRFEAISIWRSHEQGDMSEDSLHFLRLLFPHIQKALQIRQVLGVAEQRLAGAETMANASPTATFLLTRHGSVVHCNAAAKALVAQGDTLQVIDSKLATADQGLSDSLARLLSGAVSLEPASPAPMRAAALGHPRGSAKQLIAMPLTPASSGQSGAEVLLFVADPSRKPAFPDTVLHALYELTPAETEIANGLLLGYSLEEIASLRKVTLGTVRVQVKSLMSKTGTRRQSELLMLLMKLPSPTMAD